MKREMISRSYTTAWDELPIAKTGWICRSTKGDRSGFGDEIRKGQSLDL